MCRHVEVQVVAELASGVSAPSSRRPAHVANRARECGDPRRCRERERERKRQQDGGGESGKESRRMREGERDKEEGREGGMAAAEDGDKKNW